VIAALVTVAAVALAAIGAVVWATRTALERGDRAAAADVRAAGEAGRAAQLDAALATSDRLLTLAQARAAALEEALDDVDRATLVPGHVGGDPRRRVLSRWAAAELATATAARGDRPARADAVPDGGAAGGDAGPVTDPADDRG
jgi:hypothetical protein